MDVQNRIDNNNTPFVLHSFAGAIKPDATIFTDAARVIPLAPYTLMTKIAATKKWVPFTDETATNGTGLPQGIYMGPSIPAADIAAADVLDANILIFGAFVDENQLVIESAKTLDTVIGAATVQAKTVRDALKDISIIVEDTVNISSFEN